MHKLEDIQAMGMIVVEGSKDSKLLFYQIAAYLTDGPEWTSEERLLAYMKAMSIVEVTLRQLGYPLPDDFEKSKVEILEILIKTTE